MRRENLVGVLVDIGFDDHGSETYILAEFLGEGAESVVYGIAPLSDPSKRDRVLKFPKGVPMLEMETLHHSLRIHAELFPDHPLLMSPEARLAMLTDEMLAKVDYGHLVFRVALYREILRRCVEVFARECRAPFDAGQPLRPVLDGSPNREWVDDNLAQLIEELLEDDRIVEEHRDLLEALVDEIRAGIPRWQADGSYFPLSRNPLVNLLGLYAEDFISEAELHHIRRTPAFGSRVVPAHLGGLFNLVATLYFVLTGPDGRADEDSGVRVALVACDVLADVGSRHLVGLAHLWKAKLLLSRGGDGAEPSLRSALALLDGPEAAPDRHDALWLLADLIQDSDPAGARAAVREAEAIRARLTGPRR
jgi:hypothetical protein